MENRSIYSGFEFLTIDYMLSVIILTSLASYITYWFITHSPGFEKWCKKNFKSGNPKARPVICARYFGFLTLGLIPLIIVLVLTDYSISSLGLRFIPETLPRSIIWIVGLGLLAIIVNWSRRNKLDNLSKYPQIRVKIWNRNLVIQNVVSWIFYLLGYELLFRGILLFPLVDILGVWPAIVINSSFYSLAHLPKGYAETIGSIFLGMILCVLTLNTGNLLIAFGVHVILALSNFFISLVHHPDMSYYKSKRSIS